jgi:hypothetical protein
VKRCIDDLAKELGITKEQAEEILKDLSMKAGGLNSGFFDRVDDALSSEEGRFAFHLSMTNTRKEMDANAFARLMRRVLDGELGSLYENFLARLTGSTKPGFGNMVSVDSSNMYYRAQVRESLFAPLVDLGYTPSQANKLLHSRKFQDDLFSEMFSLNPEKAVTGNAEAHAVALSARAQGVKFIADFQRHGIPILPRSDYVMHQFHNPLIMAEMGFEKWFDFVYPLLKDDFSNAKANAKIVLEDIFKNIMSQKRIEGEISTQELMNSLTGNRVIPFRDAESAKVYYKKMGGDNYFDGIRESLEKMGQRLALIETFGSDPEFVFGKILELIQKREPLSPKEIAKLRNRFDQVSGLSNIVGSPSLSKISSGFLAATILFKAGKATISAFSDTVISAIRLHSLGVPFFSSYKDLLGNTLMRLPEAERLEYAKWLHSGYDSMFGFASSRYMSHDLVGGQLNKAANKFFDVIGLNYITDLQREAYSRTLSSYLGSLLRKEVSYDDLHSGLKISLGNYGIKAKEWSALTKMQLPVVLRRKTSWGGDEDLLLPHLIKDLGGDANLARKLDTFFQQDARLAIAEVAAEERAIMMSNPLTGERLYRGTLPGEFAALFFSLRGVLLKQYTKMYPIYQQMGAPNFMKHLVPLFGVGYLSIMLKDILSGKEPRDMDRDTALEAIAQSGILGIIGDVVLEALSEDGPGVGNVIAGPGINTMIQGFNFAESVIDGNMAQIVNRGKKLTPYNNVPFIEPAMNYLIWHPLSEAYSPGSVERYNRMLQREGSGLMFR